MRKSTATAIGFVAVVLWSSLALLTAQTGSIPPLQLTAMTFGLGGLVGLVAVAIRPGGLRMLRQPLPIWALGVGGLFGYHVLYFSALRAAPEVEASLIAFTWPLLIILLSALLPGEALRRKHLLGALCGFAGSALIVTGGSGLRVAAGHLDGYLLALLAAFVWAAFSVLSRRVAAVPSETIAGFCIATAVLSSAAHLLVETTVLPANPSAWLAVALLGLGPVGAAFFAWDIGVKRGNIQVLGAASYCAPLLSTVLLIGFGVNPFSWTAALACVLIVGGAIIATVDFPRPRKPARPRRARGEESTPAAD